MKPEEIQRQEAAMGTATAAMPLPGWAQANRKVVAHCKRDPVYRANVITLGRYAEWRAMFVREAELKIK